MREPLTLPCELTIYTAAELRTHWLAWLACQHAAADDDTDPSEPWRVDGAAVAEVDAAGLQLLQSLAHSVALAPTVSGQPPRLRLHEASPALARACRDLGLAELLGDADAEVAA